MQSQKENVKVLVRVRPLNKKEIDNIDNYQNFWQAKKKNSNRTKLSQAALNYFTKYHNVKPYEVIKVQNNSISVCDQQYKNAEKKMKDYVFSNVFGTAITNLNIFEASLKKDIKGVFEGINCTLLAYGITGSGKTYSVFGHPKTDKGLSHLAFEYLDEQKKQIENQNVKVQMRFSFIEIYNQNIRDLLSEDGKKLVTLNEDNKGNITIVDANEILIKSQEQLIQLMCSGTAKRTSAATESNLISSRSHAILKMSIQKIENGSKTLSKLFIIDLAGSEKISTQNNQRKHQGSNINRSLLTLGNCINALVENNKKPGGSHVPYRDSKLTRLLKDSLGGTARTIMIACISPHPFTLDETVTTLNYAERAQAIKKQFTKTLKSIQSECPRCKELLMTLSNPKKIQTQTFGKINIDEFPCSQPNEVSIEFCEKLYADIVQNARQTEKVHKIALDLVQPCQEYEMVLRQNEKQRVKLKQLLLSLLLSQRKGSNKDSETKLDSTRKRIRLSNSKKDSCRKISCHKESIKTDIETNRKEMHQSSDQPLFSPNGIQTPFHSPSQSHLREEKKVLQSIGEKDIQNRANSKRKRSKFEVVPKPSQSSARKASAEKILINRDLNV